MLEEAPRWVAGTVAPGREIGDSKYVVRQSFPDTKVTRTLSHDKKNTV